MQNIASVYDVIGLDWGMFSQDTYQKIPDLDLIIGADLFYDIKGTWRNILNVGKISKTQ
jgi:hypothetical protein